MKIKQLLIMVSIFIFVGVYAFFNGHLFPADYSNKQYEFVDQTYSYNLNTPKERWDLPEELEEISGLAFYRNNELACIQDEDGEFYIYSLKGRKIARKETFGGKGDYEGVEIVNNRAYILKSNGTIYSFEVAKTKIGEVSKIKTDLSAKNDCEGLGLYKDKSELLIALKESPETKHVELKKSRAIYRLEVPDDKFKKKPRFVIKGKDLNEALEKKGLSKRIHKPFKPSGVAVHPSSGKIFIVAHVGKLLLILEPDGSISDLIPLNPKLLVQPEGICFDPKGNLYISSEGRGNNGYILKF